MQDLRHQVFMLALTQNDIRLLINLIPVDEIHSATRIGLIDEGIHIAVWDARCDSLKCIL